jgi:uncharacterized RDD family membrane protein YckC
MSDPTSQPSSGRAGFWRRALAFTIDLCLIGLLISVTGVFSFRLTDGRVRLSSAVFDISICSKADPQQIGLQIPQHFNVSTAQDCTKTFFGLEHDRIVTITEVTQSGSVTYKRSITYPLDLNGRPTEALYLDFLWLILAPAYFLFAEWHYARTIGKGLMRVRIRSLNGGPIDFGQALKRAVIRFLPWPFWALAYVFPISQNLTLFISVAALMSITGLAVALNFLLATRRRLLPWDDAWAATEVVGN